jgi:hypothetical protein
MLETGDHIYYYGAFDEVTGKIGSKELLTHHGIYIGNDQVCHFAGGTGTTDKALVKIDSLDQFAVGKSIYVAEYGTLKIGHGKYERSKAFTGEEIAKRAKQLIESKYNIITFNCESMSTYCSTGEAISNQINNALLAIAVITPVLHVVAIPYLWFVAGKRVMSSIGSLFVVERKEKGIITAFDTCLVNVLPQLDPNIQFNFINDQKVIQHHQMMQEGYQKMLEKPEIQKQFQEMYEMIHKKNIEKLKEQQIPEITTWELTSHNTMKSDYRNSNSSYCFIHSPHSQNGGWDFQLVDEENKLFKIIFRDDKSNESGRELCVHSEESFDTRDSSSKHVILHTQICDFNNLWSIKNIGEDVFKIKLKSNEKSRDKYGLENWELCVDLNQNKTDTRNDNSIYVFVQKSNILNQQYWRIKKKNETLFSLFPCKYNIYNEISIVQSLKDSSGSCPHCNYGGLNFSDSFYYPSGPLNQCHLCKKLIKIDLKEKIVSSCTISDVESFEKWMLCAHRYYNQDKRNDVSTFVCIHEDPKPYECFWNISEVGNGFVKILMNSNNQMNWELSVHDNEIKREISESGNEGIHVMIHKPMHSHNNTWKLISVFEDIYIIELNTDDKSLKNWRLSYSFLKMDLRDHLSFFVFVEGIDSPFQSHQHYWKILKEGNSFTISPFVRK